MHEHVENMFILANSELKGVSKNAQEIDHGIMPGSGIADINATGSCCWFFT
jgi:hypothetical protein